MNWQIVLAILTCNVVLMSSSYTMLIPFLPLYLIEDLGVTPDNVNMWSGMIFSVAFIMSAIMAPIWGRMADKKGRKLMAIRASAGLAITYLLCGLVQTPLQLLIARALQGFTAGLWPAVLAIMSAYAPKEKLGLSMGILQGGLTSGGIIGPLLGGVLAHYFGMRASFFEAAAALSIITIITLIFIKEPPREEVLTTTDSQPSVKLTKVPIIRRMLIAAIIIQMAILILQPIITLYVAKLHHSMDNILMLSGFVFSLGGIAGAIASPFWGRFGQQYGFRKTLCITLFATGCILTLQTFPTTLIPFAILQFIVGLFYSGVYPSINSILVNNTLNSQRGSVFGLLFSANQIGSTIGPLIGGLIATYLALHYVFVFAAILIFITTAWLVFKPLQDKNLHV